MRRTPRLTPHSYTVLLLGYPYILSQQQSFAETNNYCRKCKIHQIPGVSTTTAEVQSVSSASMISRESSSTSTNSCNTLPISNVTFARRCTEMNETKTPCKAVRGTRIEKERLMEFTRILMKYLERMNPVMFEQAKAVLSECCKRHGKQEEGYSVDFLKKRLRQAVGECYWTRVETYHKRHVLRRCKEQR
jgi:hypothetical protein